MRRASRWIALALLPLTLAGGCARAPKRVEAPYHPPVSYVSPPHAAEAFYHTVEKGQTLYRVSKMYHVGLDELMRVNQIKDPSTLEVGQRLLIPGRAVEGPRAGLPAGAASVPEVERLLGRPWKSAEWRTITVHHSATDRGSAQNFHRDHLRRRMGGLFYHFVIGNGSNTADGKVEVGWRWQKQVKANRPYDIQICLVGNFSKVEPSDAQFESLVNLITVLRRQYGIPLANVRKHEDIKGKHTACPGKYFPFEKLLDRLSRA